MCFLTWTDSATPRKRLLFRLVPSTPRTDGTECGWWPTPQARDYRSGDDPAGKRAQRKRAQGWSPNLNDVVRLWPTPSASEDAAGTVNGKMQFMLTHAAKLSGPEATANGGQLNPQFVEWLMGFPIGWTDLKHSETP